MKLFFLYLLYFFFAEVHECLENAHLCEHNCTNTAGSYFCSCYPGYFLASNNFSCTSECSFASWPGDTSHLFINLPLSLIDIDECGARIANCVQTCIDTPGSYSCGCRTGFALAADGYTCNGKKDTCDLMC